MSRIVNMNRYLFAGLAYVPSTHRLYKRLPKTCRVRQLVVMKGKRITRYYWPADVVREYQERFPERSLKQS